MTTAHTNASAPWTAIPTSRNGSSATHTNGKSTSAKRANGQHTTKRMHQRGKANILYLREEYPKSSMPVTETENRQLETDYWAFESGFRRLNPWPLLEPLSRQPRFLAPASSKIPHKAPS